MKALQNVKLDQERRLQKLLEEKSEFDFKAKLIENNVEDVDYVIKVFLLFRLSV